MMADASQPEKIALGELQRVDPRTIWAHEERDFTPWLRDHADVLGKALGLDLAITEAEVAVGGFCADLVGDDITNGRRLVVENQLDATDHGHLGQLLTYSAGLSAATVVWISPAFREEHRQALDWLNSHTDDTLEFFGLQLEVLKIGDSLPAPSLKPVSTPNEWTQQAKRVVRSAEPSDLNTSRQRFFEGALAELKKRNPGITNATRVGPQNWFTIAAGRTGFFLYWWFSTDKGLRTALWIDVGDPVANKAFFDALAADRDSYEREVGGSLEWERLDEKKASRICVSHGLSGKGPLDSDGTLREWAVTTMLAFARTFRPAVKRLVPMATQPTTLPGPEEAPEDGRID